MHDGRGVTPNDPKALLIELRGWLESITLNYESFEDVFVDFGPPGFGHPLSELDETVAGFLSFLHVHAVCLRELQMRLLPRKEWERHAEAGFDLADASPQVILLAALADQPIVACSLRMVGRARDPRKISSLRRHLPRLVTMLEDGLEQNGSQGFLEETAIPSDVVRIASNLRGSEADILVALLGGSNYRKGLLHSSPRMSDGSLKRRLPELRRQGLIDFRRDGSTHEYCLTPMGEAVARVCRNR